MAHRGYVPQVHGRAASAGDDDVTNLRHRAKLVERAHEILLGALLETAAGEVDVFCPELAGHLLDRDSELGQFRRVDRDLDLIFQTTTHLDRGNPKCGLQILLELLVRKTPETFQLLLIEATIIDRIQSGQAHACRNRTHLCGLPRRRSPVEPETHDGIEGRVEAQQHRPLDVQRKFDSIELLAYVETGLVHVGAPGKIEKDVRPPRARDRAHTPDVLDHTKRLFDRLGDQILDFHRRRTRILCANSQGRVAKIGKEVDLQPVEGNKSEKQDGEREHGNRHPPPGGNLNEFHGVMMGLRSRVSGLWCVVLRCSVYRVPRSICGSLFPRAE